jgi:hypothetical protein
MEKLHPAPIPFIKKVRSSVTTDGSKTANSQDDDDDKSNYASFSFYISDGGEEENASKAVIKVKKFEWGSPEEWCKLREQVDELAKSMDCHAENDENTVKQRKIMQAVLTGKGLEIFNTKSTERKTANDALNAATRKTEAQVFKLVLNDMAKKIFLKPEAAYNVQKHFMKTQLRIGNMTVDDFCDRLEKVNKYLVYFPKFRGTGPRPMAGNELMEVLDRAKRPEWVAKMLEQGRVSWSFENYDELKDFYRQLEQSEEARKILHAATAQRKKTSKRKSSDNEKSAGQGDGRERKRHRNSRSNNKKCGQCGKPGHETADCWELEKNAGKRPKGYKTKGNITKEQVFAAVKLYQSQQQAEARAKKPDTRRKRQITIDDSSDEETDNLGLHNTDSGSDSESSTGKRKVRVRRHVRFNRNVTTHIFDPKSTPKSDLKNSDKCLHKNAYFSTETAFPFVERIPAKKRTKNSHFSAEVIVEIEDRDGNLVPIRALLDTGTSKTIMLRKFVKKGRAKGYKGKSTVWQTLGGTYTTKRKALLDFKFPELSTTREVSWVCHVDDRTESKTALYDMIIGMDLMCDIGIYVNTKDKTVVWEDIAVPLKERGDLQDTAMCELLYHVVQEPEILKEAEERHARILDADYSKVELEEYVKELTYLSSEEQQQLKNSLMKFDTLFSGGLGTLNIKPIHLELIDGAKPYHSKAYPVPQSLERTTKKEIERLSGITVLERDSDTEWAAPTFIQPKKTGDVRVLTDFRRLNAVLKRKPFPLPKINDVLQKLANFKYATAIDLSMGYYHIPLDEESQKLCTTILPWGKYKYKRLPMGIKNSPDIFQSIMNELLGDLDYCRVYLDDILITSSGSFAEHLQKMETVLSRLQKANFRANVRKCFFGKGELEYLGYWVTRQSIQPQPKKVEAILRLQAPKTKRQLRHFLGMVNYYRDMWQRRSHILAPLTSLVSKDAKYIWGKEQDKAFKEMKRVISEKTQLYLPDFNKEFHIYTDASDYQLGAVIMQDDKPLAFYSRKMNNAQKRYTTGEQELLSIVETLKEFRNILLGQKLIVHTDHKNIVYGKLSNDRIVRWRLLLEEYGPEYVHIKGKDNIVADALSRLDITQNNSEHSEDRKAQNDHEDDNETEGQICACALAVLKIDEAHAPILTREEQAYALTRKKQVDEEKFPLLPSLIQREQRKDKKLKEKMKAKPESFKTKQIEGASVIVNKEGKIAIPESLQDRILHWYHQYLVHPGERRMELTLKQTMTWPSMAEDVKRVVKNCKQCQLCKPRKNYGHLPVKQIGETKPWNRVDVDMIGPLSVDTPSGKRYLRALTMIDPNTGWFEVKDVPDATSKRCMEAMDDVWLSRYPRPEYLGYDGGSEFKSVFDDMRQNYGMGKAQSTPYNPQANGVIERVHQVLNNCLKTFELENRELDAVDPWTPFLSASAFAIRSTIHTTLGATPAQLVFGRDMLLPMTFEADWAMIRQRRQTEAEKNNRKENKKRIRHKYKVNDKVLLTIPGIKPKLHTPRQGPYKVTRVYTNGTIRIRRGHVTERVNIRRVTPFFENDSN